jgi:predicted lipid-binding transport protein (Tim44 family)
VNGRSGTSNFEFVIDEPIDIVVITKYEKNHGPDVVLNVAPSMGGTLFKGMGIAFIFFFGFGFIGIAIIIITIIMHIRARTNYKKDIETVDDSNITMHVRAKIKFKKDK